jgi:oligopeptidase B
LSDTIADVEPDLAWANDNQTVLYIEKDKETLLGLYVKKHVLHTDPAQDVLVFEQTDKTLYTGISKSKSDRFLFIQMDGTLTSECHYADANDPTLSFKVFLPRRRGHEYEIEHLGDRFIVRTNWQARNFRLMWVPIGDEMSQTHWQDLVAHRDDTFIEDFDIFRRFVVLSVRSGGLRKLSVQPWSRRVRRHSS